MKTKWMITNVLILIASIIGHAETIAVTNFSTNGVEVKPEIAAKLARFELVKLEKYKVLDEFDMAEVIESNEAYSACYGKSCLVEIGEKLGVDYVLSGSVDQLGPKIVVTIKLIDVLNKTLKSTRTMEFDNQESELQRMIGIVLAEMHGLTADPVTKTQLAFKNEVITSNNVGRMNNSGPRVGVSYVGFGELNKFFTRRESQGGLGIQPFMTNIGYQFEAQYIGTENFSALGEMIFNVGGMEQGQFIPSVSLLNGFRFGKAGWEFAFGPSFGIRKTSMGFFDSDGKYYRSSEWEKASYDAWRSNPDNVDPVTGDVLVAYVAPDESLYTRVLDKRGNAELSANWIMAFGRTFRSGALNIPVNMYYSSNQYGGIIGASIGFNVNKRIKSIN
jgi:TolB-like protein